jgi:peroxiredoxin
VPAGVASRGSIRVLDTSCQLAFAADGPVHTRALAAALRELHIDRRLTGAGPLVPIKGPGVPPADLLIEPVPGRPIKLRHLRGQPILFAFVREWAVPCLAVLHEITTAFQRLAGRGVTVVAVLTGATAEQAAAFQSRQGLPFSVLADPSAAIAKSCAIALWPTILWMEGERQVWTRAGATSAVMAAWTRAHQPDG